MKKITVLILIFCTTFLTCCSKDSNSPTTTIVPKIEVTKNITVDGLNRSFAIYVPETVSNQAKMPVIFVLHGGKGNPSSMMTVANFKPIADRDKVILVYPVGMIFTG